jgi:hypothetical protein
MESGHEPWEPVVWPSRRELKTNSALPFFFFFRGKGLQVQHDHGALGGIASFRFFSQK